MPRSRFARRGECVSCACVMRLDDARKGPQCRGPVRVLRWTCIGQLRGIMCTQRQTSTGGMAALTSGDGVSLDTHQSWWDARVAPTYSACLAGGVAG